MSRDGLIEVNETKETAQRISKREQEADYTKQPEQPQDAAARASPPGLSGMPPVSPPARRSI